MRKYTLIATKDSTEDMHTIRFVVYGFTGSIYLRSDRRLRAAAETRHGTGSSRSAGDGESIPIDEAER